MDGLRSSEWSIRTERIGERRGVLALLLLLLLLLLLVLERGLGGVEHGGFGDLIADCGESGLTVD
jgi:hypothetical protein